MEPLLLGISGPLGSGKDTAFSFIEEWAERRGLRAVRRAFADPLKISAARAIGIDGTPDELIEKMNLLKLEGKVHTHWDTEPGVQDGRCISGRQFLQRYGTEAHREVFGDSFWTDATLPLGGGDRGENIRWPYRFQYDAGDGEVAIADICVVTDVRFDNEAYRIRELGGRIIVVVRPGERSDTHASEQGITIYDHLVSNNSTLDQFRENVENLITWIVDDDE